MTIVTVVRNRERTIAHCLESVASQDYPNVEHVVIDGASTDGTIDILRARLGTGAKLISEPDHGIYDALNKGLHAANGDIVGFLHADDFFAGRGVITTVVRAFLDYSVDGVYGDLDYVNASNPAQIVRRWRSGKFTKSKLKWGWMPPHPTLYVRRNIYDAIGGFDTTYSISADYLSILRIFTNYKFSAAYLPEVLVRMRTGGVSNRSLHNIIKKTREDLRAARQVAIGPLGAFGTVAAKNFRKLTQFL